ncbi:uncharacterized protein Z518_08966 [Rhinocladiella mackenziei CBS 650.93]|uniref:Stress-response A/B barrel domain-containing protein n=1 Tax=Rhinocladiella mackenziei CBS 650.93 TaxID=1442369 RepID=A0A0D2IDD2_9EURO|nr:uncharacterized protein Z518_08966 [Rhinocladiella mackenziei CBS 650.93]KIX01241.1 hypothetical protein Z518_08966 [Rhinocladiella mackenziei CBS 650.93]
MSNGNETMSVKYDRPILLATKSGFAAPLLIPSTPLNTERQQTDQQFARARLRKLALPYSHQLLEQFVIGSDFAQTTTYLRVTIISITRAVQVQFKKDLPANELDETLKQVYAMKDKCIHAETQQPYMKSVKVGKNQAPEPLNNDFTHQFVMEFSSAADRDYKSAKDPYHQSVMGVLTPQIEKVQIMDIVDGQY